MLRRAIALSCLLASVAGSASAQVTRLTVLQADNRRAPTAADLATLRSGARSEDALIVRPAVRALGRLERPALIPDLVPYLTHGVPEIRAEAANAIAQAAQPWKRDAPPRAAFDAALTALTSRLKVEGVADVRAALADAIGRLSYPSADAASRGAQAILEFDGRAESVTDRLGVSRGLEAFTRLTKKFGPPSPEVIEALRRLAAPRGDGAVDARVRRLAFEALQSASAVSDALAVAGLRDSDAQVRRLAVRAAPVASLLTAVHDSAAMVRLEALMQLKARKTDEMCVATLTAVADPDVAVSLIAIDQLSGCAALPDAVALLDRTASETDAVAARTWHRPAHAIVSLAAVAPERATELLPRFSSASIWQMRMYAARTAAALRNRAALDALAFDADDNVRETAVSALRTLAGHDADATYVVQLTRHGNQILRAAAAALEGTGDHDTAVPALRAALDRVNADGGDNAHDARDALVKTLTGLGEHVTVPVRRAEEISIDAAELKRLAAPRARVTIRGVGSFELALIAAEAPATVLRFAQLAESGYYNGLTFHRIVPNFVVQGGSPGANEYVGASPFMRDEVGLWPHVRGAVGISTRGRDTGDAQIFVDLVDNPRLDHEYTVFAQVLSGVETIDQLLEGDVIEKVEIITN